MNWDAIAAIGQVLGSIAVFVTLGYLAAQVRHARDEVRRSVVHARAEMVRQQLIAVATMGDPDGHYANVRAALGTQHPPSVTELVNRFATPEEAAYRMLAMENAWWQIRSDAIQNLDLLSEADRTQFDARIRALYRAGTASSLFYQTMKPTFNTDITRYVDNLLAQPN